MSRPARLLFAAIALAGCTDRPPSWDALLTDRITSHYPAYSIGPAPGGLLVTRPGLPAITVAVQPIAAFCQRGPRDCEYAIDQMLLELAPQKP